MTYDCKRSLKAQELDPTVSIYRGINSDWADFKTQQPAVEFHDWMCRNHMGGASLCYSKHNNIYEVRWR